MAAYRWSPSIACQSIRLSLSEGTASGTSHRIFAEASAAKGRKGDWERGGILAPHGAAADLSGNLSVFDADLKILLALARRVC